MGDGDGGVVAFEEGAEGLVDERFGFGVEGGRGCTLSVCRAEMKKGLMKITFV